VNASSILEGLLLLVVTVAELGIFFAVVVPASGGADANGF
jgi:hypothetical protein